MEDTIYGKNLPHQKFPQVSHVTDVNVITGTNPWNFYVLPKYLNWSLEKDAQLTLTELHGLVRNMTTFFYTNSTSPVVKSCDWKNNQLVAVEYLTIEKLTNLKMEPGFNTCIPIGDTNWYRAVIEQNRNKRPNSDEKLHVFLIDIGIELDVPKNRVRFVPNIYGNIAPMAYKCRLTGVSPIFKWTAATIQGFFNLVKNGTCLASVARLNVVKNPRLYSLQGPTPDKFDILDDSHPCLLDVDLFVQQCLPGSSLARVADKLVEEFDCLSWNLFPHRPEIVNKLSRAVSVMHYNPSVLDEPYIRPRKAVEIDEQRFMQILKENEDENDVRGDRRVICFVQNDATLSSEKKKDLLC